MCKSNQGLSNLEQTRGSRQMSILHQDQKDFWVCGRNMEAIQPFVLLLRFSELATASFCCSSLQKPERCRPSLGHFQKHGGHAVSQPQTTLQQRRWSLPFPPPQIRGSCPCRLGPVVNSLWGNLLKILSLDEENPLLFIHPLNKYLLCLHNANYMYKHRGHIR